MDCPVCCEKSNYTVVCECKFTCCRSCVRTYLTGQVSEPHCMSCKIAWNMEFLETAIGKTYLKTDFKKQRALVFAEHEKTQLPQMQEDARIYEITENLNKNIIELKRENDNYVNGTYGCNWCIGNKFKLFKGCDTCKNVSTVDKIKIENIRILNLTTRPERIVDYVRRMDAQKYNTYFHRYCNNYRLKCKNCSSNYPYSLLLNILVEPDIVTNITCDECNYVTCITCCNEKHDGEPCVMTECNCHEYECDNCLKEYNDYKIRQFREQISVINSKEEKSKERKIFMMKCQVNECKGFLSQAYKCGLCSKYTCSHCYMPKEDGHECNPDNVASAKMIKEETRPCPKCSARIYKIDGCDQMWCTDCRTAFSWRTGVIVNGHIHNPHYYEHLRNTTGHVPRADQPFNPCGEIIDIHELSSFRRMLDRYVKKITMIRLIEHNVQSIHHYLGEVNDVYNRIYNEINDPDGDRYTKQLKHNRILFLLNRIDKEKFEKDAFMYHQRSTQHRRFLELVQMLRQVVSDIFNNLYGWLNEKINKEKKFTHEDIIKSIKDNYKELFAVIAYFNKQHTLNPYTKIYTDHYITTFNAYKLSEDGSGSFILSPPFFEVPGEMEDNIRYEMYFTYVSPETKKISKKNAIHHDDDYDSDY
jgi:hypothetical protein